MSTTTALLLTLLAGAPVARTAGAGAEDVAPLKLPSLRGAESLHGGSLAVGWAGFSTKENGSIPRP